MLSYGVNNNNAVMITSSQHDCRCCVSTMWRMWSDFIASQEQYILFSGTSTMQSIVNNAKGRYNMIIMIQVIVTVFWRLGMPFLPSLCLLQERWWNKALEETFYVKNSVLQVQHDIPLAGFNRHNTDVMALESSYPPNSVADVDVFCTISHGENDVTMTTQIYEPKEKDIKPLWRTYFGSTSYGDLVPEVVLTRKFARCIQALHAANKATTLVFTVVFIIMHRRTHYVIMLYTTRTMIYWSSLVLHSGHSWARCSITSL